MSTLIRVRRTYGLIDLLWQAKNWENGGALKRIRDSDKHNKCDLLKKQVDFNVNLFRLLG